MLRLAAAPSTRAVAAVMTRLSSLNPAIAAHRLLHPSSSQLHRPSPSPLMSSRLNHGIINVPARGFARYSDEDDQFGDVEEAVEERDDHDDHYDCDEKEREDDDVVEDRAPKGDVFTAAFGEETISQKSLGGGLKSKAERMAQVKKNRRKALAAALEEKKKKGKLEKERLRAARAASYRKEGIMVTNIDDMLADGEALVVEEDEDVAVPEPSDKRMAKALEAAARDAAAQVAPTQPDKKLSPAQIAAAAKAAAKAKAELARIAAEVRVNEKIRGDKLVVIDDEGKNHGLISRHEALALARSKQLDLLQVSPTTLTTKPPVCKILNYKHYAQAQRRKEKEAKRVARLSKKELKTMRFRSKIASGDLLFKIRRMKQFLRKGHPVKVMYTTRNPDPNIFMPMFTTILNHLALDGTTDAAALSPEKPFLAFNPVSTKRRSALYANLTEEQKELLGVCKDENGNWTDRDKMEMERRAARGEEDEEEMDEEEEEDEEDNEESEENEDEQKAATSSAPAQQAKTMMEPAESSSKAGKKEKHKNKKKPKFEVPVMFGARARA